MPLGSLTKLSLTAVIIFGLAACDNAEERAEKHYEKGVELLAAGDVDRALVELRNVLTLNDLHSDARRLYARTALDRGNLPEAYRNFNRLAEEDPNDMESRLELARLSIDTLNWTDAQRHAEALIEANSELPGVDLVEFLVKFQQAVTDGDADVIQALTAQAETLSEKYPDDINLLRVMIEGHARAQRYEVVSDRLDSAIDLEPDNREYYDLKTSVLAAQEDALGLEDHLRKVVEQFPNDLKAKADLVRLFIGTGQNEAAENFFRDQMKINEDPTEMHVSLIAFLRETKGDEEALAEINAALPLYEDNGIFRSLRAGIKFDSGEREEAIAELQSVLEDTEDPVVANRFRIALARMLRAVGNDVGARQLVEETLAVDETNVAALKLSALQKIETDNIDSAISDLRTALDQDPEDAEAMTLMARAHRRAGETELAQDLLALAAEASGFAPAESLRFARLLIEEDRLRPAEDLLITSLRANPDNFDLLVALGEVYLASEDWQRAESVETSLRRLNGENSVAAADQIRLQLLSLREGRGQALAFLEQLAQSEDAGDGPQLALLGEKLRDGDSEEAIAIAEKIVSENPGNPRAELVLGNTQLATRGFSEAETTFRKIVDENPNFEQAWLQLLRSQSAQGHADDALATVDEALAKNPNAPNILWAKASFLERTSDIDGAIEIYEALYAQNSDALVVANNLASLLATYREDDASLERAYSIGRRLRGTQVAPFQDTYGWILYRRGDFDESLTYLEPAARALSNDPIVLFHLASAYNATEQKEKALEIYKAVILLTGEDDPRPQIQETVAAIEALSAANANSE